MLGPHINRCFHTARAADGAGKQERAAPGDLHAAYWSGCVVALWA